MSRYIRTKNGVYELISDLDNKGYNVKVENHGTYKLVSKATILAHANTIKELCDEFVCIDNRGKEYRPFRFYFLSDLYSFIKANNLFERYIVYGSIWVDGNLIKVAQMNDKGELELL